MEAEKGSFLTNVGHFPPPSNFTSLPPSPTKILVAVMDDQGKREELLYGLDFMKGRHERKTRGLSLRVLIMARKKAKALINREEEGRLPPTLA